MIVKACVALRLGEPLSKSSQADQICGVALRFRSASRKRFLWSDLTMHWSERTRGAEQDLISVWIAVAELVEMNVVPSAMVTLEIAARVGGFIRSIGYGRLQGQRCGCVGRSEGIGQNPRSIRWCW